jgi:hypothetical protein
MKFVERMQIKNLKATVQNDRMPAQEYKAFHLHLPVKNTKVDIEPAIDFYKRV